MCAECFSLVYRHTSEFQLSKHAITLNVIAIKDEIDIQLIVGQLRFVQIPDGKHVIITGPDPLPINVGEAAQQTAVTHEEADVIMAYHMIKMVVTGLSPMTSQRVLPRLHNVLKKRVP